MRRLHPVQLDLSQIKGLIELIGYAADNGDLADIPEHAQAIIEAGVQLEVVRKVMEPPDYHIGNQFTKLPLNPIKLIE